MRIAMYTDAFYPYVSGLSTAVIALADELAKEGHFIFIQAPRPKEEVDLSWLHPNIIVNYVRSTEIFIYPDFRLGTKNPIAIDAIKTFNPDIIHVHSPLSIGLEGIMTAKRLKLPLIQTFHTYYMDQDGMKLLGIHNHRLANLLSAGGWRLTRALGRLFDVTTAPSHFVEKDLKEHAIPGEIMYCPNILPEKYFSAHPRRKGDVHSFLFVGRLAPEKKVDVLLKSFSRVIKSTRRLDLELHVIGDGPQREMLVNLAFDLDIARNVRWHGKIPHDELMEKHWYHMSDIFVTASRFETFGYTTLEAMAHGLPVIAHAYRANTELVGDTGFLIPDTTDESEAIQLIATALEESLETDISELRRAAYQRAQEYKPAEAIPLYEAAYRRAQELNSADDSETWEEVDSKEYEQ